MPPTSRRAPRRPRGRGSPRSRPPTQTFRRPAVGGRPSMGWPGAKYQTGLEHIDTLEVLAPRLIARLTGARFAEVRSQSATLANLAVYTALAAPGDTIAVLPA